MLYSYKIEQAIRAAAVLHNGQTRKGIAPYPYITHLVAVAFLISDYTDDENTIIAGLLHDTLEDTDYSPDELETDFGPLVRKIIEGVTDAQLHERSLFTWKERQKEYFKALSQAPTESLIVSAADKIHNMRSIVEEYDGKPDLFVSHFGSSIEDLQNKYEKLKILLHERLKNDILNEYDHVHELFKAFLITTQAHYDNKKQHPETKEEK